MTSTERIKSTSAVSDPMLVSQRPIDLSGDMATFDRLVREEALAQAHDGMNRDLPMLGESRHAHARVFDANRYSVRTYVSEFEGTGYWDLYRLSKNMFVMIADCEYKQAKWLATPDPGFFKIRLLWSGRLLTEDSRLLLKPPGAMLAVYPELGQGGYFVGEGESFRIVILNCTMATLTEDMGLDPSSLPPPLRAGHSQDGKLPITRELDLTPRLVNALSDLLDARDLYSSYLRSWFVEAKTKEILGTVVQGLMNEQEPEIAATTQRISRRDRHRILEAQEIIKANLSDLPTIPALSRMVGINRTKLKAGFKAVVGTTIGDYTRQQQMEAAARMLQTGGRSVSEIGYAVGYRHPANFSYAFKKFYGCLPTAMRKRARVVQSEMPKP